MTSILDAADLDRLIYEGAIRLALIGPRQWPIWEASPSPLHQWVVRTIEQSIARDAAAEDDGCACLSIADTYFRFPDRTLVRPDIAIICEPPPRQREAWEHVPPAVIEILSPGYETKDEELVPVYLGNGVGDVVLVDPERALATHYHGGDSQVHGLPVRLRLGCGCVLTIPA